MEKMNNSSTNRKYSERKSKTPSFLIWAPLIYIVQLRRKKTHKSILKTYFWDHMIIRMEKMNNSLTNEKCPQGKS